jgi:hypothetical protein
MDSNDRPASAPRLSRISVAADGSVWGLDAAGTLMRNTEDVTTWVVRPGPRLVSVARGRTVRSTPLTRPGSSTPTGTARRTWAPSPAGSWRRCRWAARTRCGAPTRRAGCSGTTRARRRGAPPPRRRAGQWHRYPRPWMLAGCYRTGEPAGQDRRWRGPGRVVGGHDGPAVPVRTCGSSTGPSGARHRTAGP